MASREDEDEPKFCTCCGDEDDGQLVHPCDCRGSAKWIHEHCLEAMQSAGPWVAAAHRCDQCMNEHFGALYDELSARVHAECTNGQASPNTLSTLASELQAQGRYEDAEPLIGEAVGSLRANLGDRHPATLSTITNLCFLDLGDRYRFGREPLRRAAAAVEWLREKFGDRHPATLTCISNLGALLLEQGGPAAAAEPFYREVMEGQRERLGDRHPDTLCAISNLAALLRKKGDFAAAEPLYREVLEVQGQTLGVRHPDTVNTITTLDALTLSKWETDIGPDEYTPKMFVCIAMGKMMEEEDGMGMSFGNYLAFNYPDVFEVFERRGGMRTRLVTDTTSGASSSGSSGPFRLLHAQSIDLIPSTTGKDTYTEDERDEKDWVIMRPLFSGMHPLLFVRYVYTIVQYVYTYAPTYAFTCVFTVYRRPAQVEPHAVHVHPLRHREDQRAGYRGAARAL